MSWLQNSSWHYCLRLPCDVNLHGPRRHPMELMYLWLPKGEAVLYHNVGLWLDGQCRCNDVHLGKLATYLRLLGFDTWYRNDCEDEELAIISDSEQRILLTRDRGLLKRSIVTYGYWVKAIAPIQQSREVLNRFALWDQIKPFQRCLRCNGKLVPVKRNEIAARLATKTRQYYTDFSLCQRCQQIYWKGSHYSDLEKLVRQIIGLRPSNTTLS